ncbi:hypothetical protein QWY31_11455 [Cytophagales bacterium LB-30]|uniref:CHAD domain-containing protein n=1 Tax=Shiella aurantiaca TaxID=3058365 RepID=A0ABT8F6L8_9BACT|nr:hypothetical protein [Shiella aurantiaca]MDN4166122.1 hypothetical protein [Shiella aurantiaca]
MKIQKFHITTFVANQYATLFGTLSQKIDLLFEHLNNDFIITGNRVKKYHKIAREKLKNREFTPDMEDKIRHAVKCFDIIIVELQYHDIIRQKLEHINTFEIKLAQEFSEIYEKKNAFCNPRYTLVMYDLVKLAYRQLNAIRSDYLTASLKIQKLLLQLWTDREISRELQLFLFNTAENLKNVLDSLDAILKMHEKLRKENPDIDVAISQETRMEILEEVKKCYTMESERLIFNDLFQIVEAEKDPVEDDIFF